MFHIGLDVHWKTTSICILNDDGKVVKEKTIPGPLDRTISYLAKVLDGPSQVVFEATGHYGFIYESLQSLKKVRRVVVAHPGKARLIFQSKQKNDRVDARKLAKLLYLDAVPTAYVPTKSIRLWRELIEYRQKLVARSVRCKNTLRALLRKQGLVSPKGLWSRCGLAWLASQAMPEMQDLQRDLLLDELTLHRHSMAKVTRKLNQMGLANPSVQLLQTIPGIGPRTSEAMVAYVADPHRFRTVRSVGTYFGLVPCQDASAGKNRYGHITKEGPATVRKLLVEAAWQVVRRCPSMRRKFEAACHGRQDRRKIALVGTARHLACVMLAMLRTGETWRETA
jgi:transposase